MGETAENVRLLERALRRLFQIRKDKDGLLEMTVEDETEIEKAGGLRAMWQQVKVLEEAEETYRQQTAEIARARGVDVARLVMVDADKDVPAHFILTVPTMGRVSEARIADGLRKVIQMTMGGIFMEHEALKASMAAIIITAGNFLPTCEDDQHKARIYDAMVKFDIVELAGLLGMNDGLVPERS